jgi:hypothetical protein
MVRGLVMIAGFMMLCCLAMVFGRVFMVFRGLLMMLVYFVLGHLFTSRERMIATPSFTVIDELFATPSSLSRR